MSVTLLKDQSELDSVLSDRGIVAVDYYQDPCKPCRTFEPKFEASAKQYDKIKFVKVNVAKLDMDFIMESNLRAAPTVIIYSELGEVQRFNGYDLVNGEYEKQLQERFGSS